MLWLWQKHNALNLRLAAEARLRPRAANRAGDDASHPKAIFPSAAACPQCVDASRTHWHVPGVLGFLDDSYCSRQPTDAAFACARQRAGLPPDGAGGRAAGAAEDVVVGGGSGGWRGAVSMLAACLLCCGLAGLPWLCRGRCERLSLQLDAYEDRRLGSQILKDAARDEAAAAEQAEAERAAAEAQAAARARADASTPPQGASRGYATLQEGDDDEDDDDELLPGSSTRH